MRAAACLSAQVKIHTHFSHGFLSGKQNDEAYVVNHPREASFTIESNDDIADGI